MLHSKTEPPAKVALKREWSKHDLEYLQKNYKKFSWGQMEKDLGRNKSAIIQKAYRLKINRKRSWTLKDNQYLEDYYNELDIKGLAQDLSRSVGAVRHQLRSLGFNGEQNNSWTRQEISSLRTFYPYEDRELIQRHIPNRTWNAISLKASRLGVHRMTPVLHQIQIQMQKDTDLLKILSNMYERDNQ